MPITKPSTLPRWADAGGALTTPMSGKQDVGWLVNEKPPAQIMNWLQNNVYQWMQYLNDLPNQALSWTVQQIFNGLVQLNGDGVATNPIIRSIRNFLGATGGRTLIWQGDDGNSAHSDNRLYIFLSSGVLTFELCTNCTWNSGTGLWSLLDASQPAYRQSIGSLNAMYSKASSSSAWNDSSWMLIYLLKSDGLDFASDHGIGHTGAVTTMHGTVVMDDTVTADSFLWPVPLLSIITIPACGFVNAFNAGYLPGHGFTHIDHTQVMTVEGNFPFPVGVSIDSDYAVLINAVSSGSGPYAPACLVTNYQKTGTNTYTPTEWTVEQPSGAPNNSIGVMTAHLANSLVMPTDSYTVFRFEFPAVASGNTLYFQAARIGYRMAGPGLPR